MIQRVAILIQRTNESMIVEEFRVSACSDSVQRTNESMIVEEFRVSAGSDSDTAHEPKPSNEGLPAPLWHHPDFSQNVSPAFDGHARSMRVLVFAREGIWRPLPHPGDFSDVYLRLFL